MCTASGRIGSSMLALVGRGSVAALADGAAPRAGGGTPSANASAPTISAADAKHCAGSTAAACANHASNAGGSVTLAAPP
jgi:hypothetical protein